METAVILCSGGLNSAVTAALAKQEHELALLHVNIPHRAAEREGENFNALAHHFAVAHVQRIDMPHMAELGHSMRLDMQSVLPSFTASPSELAATAIPGLVGSLITAAHVWAAALGASKIYIGISENLGPPCPRTSNVWPEYSREYISHVTHMLAAACPDVPVTLVAPLVDLTRGEIIQLGRKLGVPFQHTWSCVESAESPCKRCLGCATRARGFLDAMMPDPVMAADMIGV